MLPLRIVRITGKAPEKEVGGREQDRFAIEQRAVFNRAGKQRLASA